MRVPIIQSIFERYAHAYQSADFILNLAPFIQGHQCCSSQAVSFWNVTDAQMMIYELLIYHLHVVDMALR